VHLLSLTEDFSSAEHTLPVERHVDFKLARFVYWSGQAPLYLADDLVLESQKKDVGSTRPPTDRALFHTQHIW